MELDQQTTQENLAIHNFNEINENHDLSANLDTINYKMMLMMSASGNNSQTSHAKMLPQSPLLSTSLCHSPLKVHSPLTRQKQQQNQQSKDLCDSLMSSPQSNANSASSQNVNVNVNVNSSAVKYCPFFDAHYWRYTTFFFARIFFSRKFNRLDKFKKKQEVLCVFLRLVKFVLFVERIYFLFFTLN